MKKYAVATAFLLIIGLSTGIVNGTNNSSDGDMQISKGSGSSSATTSVGPNGTQYDTYFSVTEQNLSAETTGITDSRFDGDTFRFNGSFQTNTPCHDLQHEVVEEEENVYTFKISSEESNESVCVQPLAYQRYEAGFEAEEPYNVTVKHDNETVGSFAHPDYEPENGDDEKSEDQGFFASLTGFFRGFF